MNNFVNPYFPNRKIRHAKLLVEAGFHIDAGWYKKDSTGKNPNLTNVAKLIYWTNDKNESIVLFDYQQVSLKNFLKLYANAVKYNYRRRASINFAQD